VSECCDRCFGAGTLVMTADGRKPIEDVTVGERVMARDEVSGETELRTVEHVIVRNDREVFELTFADGEQREVISVTSDHRFHTTERGWVVSAELQIGEAIESLDGRRLMFEARSAQARKAPTFNLSVAEDHNYFVGESGLWVHNCTPCGDLSDVDELAKNYATARARGDVFRWTDFAEEFGIEVSGLNKSARSAIRQRARELELVQRATIDSSGVADFGPWTTDIIKRNSGESVGVSVNMPETTAMKYKSHFDYMDSLFLT